MATIPNSEVFSLQDVVNVTGGNTLALAFANSVVHYFNPAYYGNMDRLSNFRDYNTSRTPFCNVSITSQIFLRGGGSTQFTITTSAGMTWSITFGSNYWLSASPSSGVGSATITLTCQGASAPRSGSATIASTVASKYISVTQQ